MSKSILINASALKNWLISLENQTCFEQEKTYDVGFEHGFDAGQRFVLKKILELTKEPR